MDIEAKYYVISTTEDGDITIHEVSKAHVLDLAEDGASFLDKIENEDPVYWGSTNLVIKGHIVKPKPVVQNFDID